MKWKNLAQSLSSENSVLDSFVNNLLAPCMQTPSTFYPVGGDIQGSNGPLDALSLLAMLAQPFHRFRCFRFLVVLFGDVEEESSFASFLPVSEQKVQHSLLLLSGEPPICPLLQEPFALGLESSIFEEEEGSANSSLSREAGHLGMGSQRMEVPPLEEDQDLPVSLLSLLSLL
mgnify:CR=1 FL=1